MLIRQRGAWLTRTLASIDAADIVDVDFSAQDRASAAAGSGGAGPRTARVLLALARFAGGGGITVKTTQGLTRFGEGLDENEVRYLHSIIRRALQGG